MFVLIVISILTMTGPWGMRAQGGMNGFSVRLKTETACNRAKDKILAQAKEKGAGELVIAICEREE